ncbi:MAG: hypothetical protein M1813_000572 [Trichoglossum hirsutum]|nr:MAG: hypothetical protein M1813_000572 [Trichoglossum hirsutum]
MCGHHHLKRRQLGGASRAENSGESCGSWASAEPATQPYYGEQYAWPGCLSILSGTDIRADWKGNFINSSVLTSSALIQLPFLKPSAAAMLKLGKTPPTRLVKMERIDPMGSGRSAISTPKTETAAAMLKLGKTPPTRLLKMERIDPMGSGRSAISTPKAETRAVTRMLLLAVPTL